MSKEDRRFEVAVRIFSDALRGEEYIEAMEYGDVFYHGKVMYAARRAIEAADLFLIAFSEQAPLVRIRPKTTEKE